MQVTDELEASAKKFCQSLGCNPSSVKDLVENKEQYQPVWQAVAKGIEEANKKAMSRVAEVKKFTILPKEFTIAGGELGPTLKIKRHVVMTKYAEEISALYTDN